MDKKAKEAEKNYSAIMSSASASERVGRLPNTEDMEMHILNDIFLKLQLKKNDRIFDIGCGAGTIARALLEKVKNENMEILFYDFPAVIDRLREMFSAEVKLGVKIDYQTGVFPKDLPTSNQLFDKIVAYSVIHYTDFPGEFISAAVKLLAPGGRLLIGDIPNLNRKGRFLASDFGRAFDAKYKGCQINEIPKYANHQEFYKKARDPNVQNLDDEFLMKTIKSLREEGYNGFILEQPGALPFSYTREDLLICRNYE